MNEFLKSLIDEEFMRKRRKRMEKSKKIENDSSEKDVDEVVDKNGDFIVGEKPSNIETKGITSKSTTDDVVQTAANQMGNYYSLKSGRGQIRYWGESDMSKALGYDDTLGDDASYDEAYNHFVKKLGMNDDEAKERLSQLGYDEKLKEKVRLVENPKKYIEEYIENLLSKKSADNEFVEDDKESDKEVNAVIVKQIQALKKTLEKNNLTVKDIKKFLSNE